MWTTTDGGDSWTNRSVGLPNNPMQAVVYAVSDFLWGVASALAPKTLDFIDPRTVERLGHRSTMALARLVVDAIAVDPNDAQTILVAIDGSGVNRTTDGGDIVADRHWRDRCTSWTFVAVSAG